MAISNVEKTSDYVFVINDKGVRTPIHIGSNNPEDGLISFTSSVVNIRHGDYIFIYDESGSQISCAAVR